jgi:bifunctional non-homologous end joining protein LigD
VSKGVHWVKPTLVAQISFANWTRDNLLRQAAFKGLREDKPAREVVRESAVPQKDPQRNAVEKPTKPRVAEGKTNLPITHPEKLLDQESGMTWQSLSECCRTSATDH